LKKKITIIGINYYPEDTAIGLYTSQLANYFNSQDIEVTILTGFPYYPAWKISADYQSKRKFYNEKINGINIYRYKQYVPENPTFFKRIVHLIDFSLGTFINIFKVKKTDVVLCIVPFIGSILVGKILAKLKGAKLWTHIQDFEFDAVTESNILETKKKKSKLFKLLFWIEKKLLNSADSLSTISTSMLLKLKSKVDVKIKSELLPNWVDLEFINPSEYTTHSFLGSKKFKILYSGNIGEKQDWNFFIKFAKELRKELNLELILVGNGGKRDWLKQELKTFENVSFYEPVAYEDLSNLLCSADLHVLFQKSDVIDTVMPSKILAMMASQKPSLITGSLKSEVASILKESKGGEYFDSDDFNGVINFVSELRKDKELSEKYGFNARNFVSLNFSKEQILSRFKTTFKNLTK
jgi:colanic acid biosynthesis glycosyl transferase WcaI